jgi:hypothetical protein
MKSVRMNLFDLFDINRLFAIRPPVDFRFDWLLWFYAAAAVLSLLIFFLLGTRQTARNRMPRIRLIKDALKTLFYTSLVGVFLVFSRVQDVALFSMRLWLLLLILMQIGLAAYYGYMWQREIPAYEARLAKQIEKNKYLPKRKKR